MFGFASASKKAKASPAWNFLKGHVLWYEESAVRASLSAANLHFVEDFQKRGDLAERTRIFRDGSDSKLLELFGSPEFKKKLAKAIQDETITVGDRLDNKGDLNIDKAGLAHHWDLNYDVQPTPHLFTIPEGPLPPILVLGASGSGKTVFAAKIVKSRLQQSHPNVDKICSVYLTADCFRPFVEGEAAAVTVTRACKKVKDIIRREVGEANYSQYEDSKADILMVVIIDEVGLESDADWMGSNEKLNALKSKLQDIAEKVQLVLAGTGLDRVSSEVNSSQGCVKIHMKPWKYEDIEWLTNRSVHTIGFDRKEVLDLVVRTPILKALTTNARALKFLLQAVQNYGECFDGKALIDYLVKHVAFMYIHSNCLKDLESGKRSRVAKIVLKALSESKKKEPHFSPQKLFSKSDGSTVRRSFTALVETYIEQGSLTSGCDYAISISPAITIVLTSLMGCISALSSSWSGFDRIGALSELQRCFIASDKDSAPRLFRSVLSFPPTDVHTTLQVPKLWDDTIVVVNGPGAPYADIIGHKRLIQCKHTVAEATALDIREELKKLGVLKDEFYEDDSYIQHRFLTNRLLAQWYDHDSDSSERKPAATDPARRTDGPSASHDHDDIPVGGTRSMYPIGQLDYKVEHDDGIDFDEYQLIKGQFYFKDSEAPIEWDPKISNVITIVFSTNKDFFTLKLHGLDEPDDWLLSRQQLTDDGEIKRETSENVISDYLKGLVDTEKVKVRFQICSH